MGAALAMLIMECLADGCPANECSLRARGFTDEKRDAVHFVPLLPGIA